MSKSILKLGPITIAVLSVIFLVVWQRHSEGKTAASPDMVGEWEGTAQIIVDWCQQDELIVRLRIGPDNKVSGKIGDATLKNAQLKANRGRLGRFLRIKTDFIIVGQLEGPIVAAEKISRASIKIPLNFDDQQFIGGFHTSGKKLGGKKSGKLSAGLKLVRKEE